ncbi:hypothetical protein K7G98_28040 [Saccharothrix sp. MB29]|nr:hypothetical protein [Saccharothrix sp. MB29]
MLQAVNAALDDWERRAAAVERAAPTRRRCARSPNAPRRSASRACSTCAPTTNLTSIMRTIE